MVFIEGCILSIEFSDVLESSIAYQYQTAVLGAGLVLLNAMACRVFRLLRRLKTEGEETEHLVSTDPSVMQFQMGPVRGQLVTNDTIRKPPSPLSNVRRTAETVAASSARIVTLRGKWLKMISGSLRAPGIWAAPGA